MKVNFLPKETVDAHLVSELIMPNKKMKIMPGEYYKSLQWAEFRLFCHNNYRYGIVTEELLHAIKLYTDGKNSIEIGAGAGDLGYHLGIKMTDSKLQEEAHIAYMYKTMMQPVIQYPDDVEKIEALEAVKKYRPEVVVASWVTVYGHPLKNHFGCNEYGVKEEEIFNLIDTYILFGNAKIHGDKPILKLPHIEIKNSNFISRASNQEANRLYIWQKNKL